MRFSSLLVFAVVALLAGLGTHRNGLLASAFSTLESDSVAAAEAASFGGEQETQQFGNSTFDPSDFDASFESTPSQLDKIIDQLSSCIITVSNDYKLEVIGLIKARTHAGGTQTLVSLCGKAIHSMFYYTHMVPKAATGSAARAENNGFDWERKFQKYLTPDTKGASPQKFIEGFKTMRSHGEAFVTKKAAPSDECRNLARYVKGNNLGYYNAKKGRYPDNAIISARAKWMRSIHEERFPCSFARVVSHKAESFGFGVYHDNMNGARAFLEDIYNYIDSLPTLLPTQLLTGFTAQFPDALKHKKGAKSMNDPKDLDETFAKFVKRFLLRVKKLDSKISGPEEDLPDGYKDTFSFGTVAFAIQGGHPNSERLTRRMEPHPTLAFVPTYVLKLRTKLNPKSFDSDVQLKEAILFSEAIKQVQRDVDGSVNPITDPAASVPAKGAKNGIPTSCGFSGRQQNDRKYCPIIPKEDTILPRHCITSWEGYKKEWKGWRTRGSPRVDVSKGKKVKIERKKGKGQIPDPAGNINGLV